MSFLHELDRFPDQIRLLSGKIGLLANISAEVVEAHLAVEHRFANGFPVPESNGLAAALLIELPVEVGMLLLLIALTAQRWEEADRLCLFRHGLACEFADGRHDITKVTDMRRDCAGSDLARPPSDGRHADAAFC